MEQMGIPLDSAINRLLQKVAVLERYEKLPLLDGLGRVSSEYVSARIDLPPFDASPVDGFAMRHQDLAGASRDKPALLRIIETVYAGDSPTKPVGAGECVRVMTGAPIPPGATCVIRYEDTHTNKDQVTAFLALKEHENYRYRGEDIRCGQQILIKGEAITIAHIGVLAGQGFTEAQVFVRPKIGILSTGSELISGNEPLVPGKIYDSNRYLLAARVLALGGEILFGHNAEDDPHVIAHTLEALLQTADFIITTGGVSVGDHDYMPQVGNMIGAEQLFRSVQMKPGGWVTALYKDGKIILCLSGNPFAAAVSFDLLSAPVIRRLTGAAHIFPRRIQGVLQEPFPKASPYGRFLYARCEGNKVFLASSGYVSGSLASLIGCNCILEIPAGTPPLSAGDQVEVILI